MNMTNHNTELHFRVGSTFEHCVGQSLMRAYDQDIRKVTDDRASFADFQTPCRTLIELKSRKFIRQADAMDPEFITLKLAHQLKQGLEAATAENFLYVAIIGVHQVNRISELDALRNDRTAFLNAYHSAHVIYGWSTRVQYTVLDVNDIFVNPNHLTFRDSMFKWPFTGVGESRYIDIDQVLSYHGLRLDRVDTAPEAHPDMSVADKLAALQPRMKAAELARPAQELIMYDNQRRYHFDELDYASIILEDRHDKRSINATSLVYIKDLEVDQHTKKRLKDRLTSVGYVSTRIHVLNPREFFIALTFIHFGLKVAKANDKIGRLRLTKIFKNHLNDSDMKYPWKVCDTSYDYFECLRRFHEVLESKGLIHHYLIFDPITNNFKGIPSISWTHQDHVNALLKHLDDVEAPQPVAEVEELKAVAEVEVLNNARSRFLYSESRRRVHSRLAKRIIDLEYEIAERDHIIASLKKRLES